jgi:hypothetical protein
MQSEGGGDVSVMGDVYYLVSLLKGLECQSTPLCFTVEKRNQGKKKNTARS